MTTTTRPYRIMEEWVTDMGGVKSCIVSTHASEQSAREKLTRLLHRRPDLCLSIYCGREMLRDATLAARCAAIREARGEG